jgi:hypothetical protein
MPQYQIENFKIIQDFDWVSTERAAQCILQPRTYPGMGHHEGQLLLDRMLGFEIRWFRILRLAHDTLPILPKNPTRPRLGIAAIALTRIRGGDSRDRSLLTVTA